MIKELCTRLLDNKIAENENFIRFTFYELRVKNNLSENDTNEFLRLCMTYLENKGYEVYIGNARYSYNNANQNVQPNRRQEKDLITKLEKSMKLIIGIQKQMIVKR